MRVKYFAFVYSRFLVRNVDWYKLSRIATLVGYGNSRAGLIDGPGGTLAFAGFEFLRPAADGGLPFTGIMQVDTEDFALLRQDIVRYFGVVLHEVGHVLGTSRLDALSLTGWRRRL